MAPDNLPSRYTYAGLFFVALATLMYEILLTRVFSVTMLYHFAFVALSLAMFGMTAGALVVYLVPRAFEGPRFRVVYVPIEARATELRLIVVLAVEAAHEEPRRDVYLAAERTARRVFRRNP